MTWMQQFWNYSSNNSPQYTCVVLTICWWEFAALCWGRVTSCNSREAVPVNIVPHLSYFLHFKSKVRKTAKEFISHKVAWFPLHPKAISIKWWNSAPPPLPFPPVKKNKIKITQTQNVHLKSQEEREKDCNSISDIVLAVALWEL